MKRIDRIALIVLMVSVVSTACQKEDRETPSSLVKDTEVVKLYEAPSAYYKSDLQDTELTEIYSFSVNGIQGKLFITLNESGELIRSGLEKAVFEELTAKVGMEKVKGLPQAIIEKTRQMQKLGYRFWNSGAYIPPMNKDKFNEEMSKCENKPTTAGVLLCAARIITQALVECLEAPPSRAHIHCW